MPPVDATAAVIVSSPTSFFPSPKTAVPADTRLSYACTHGFTFSRAPGPVSPPRGCRPAAAAFISPSSWPARPGRLSGRRHGSSPSPTPLQRPPFLNRYPVPSLPQSPRGGVPTGHHVLDQSFLRVILVSGPVCPQRERIRGQGGQDDEMTVRGHGQFLFEDDILAGYFILDSDRPPVVASLLSLGRASLRWV